MADHTSVEWLHRASVRRINARKILELLLRDRSDVGRQDPSDTFRARRRRERAWKRVVRADFVVLEDSSDVDVLLERQLGHAAHRQRRLLGLLVGGLWNFLEERELLVLVANLEEYANDCQFASRVLVHEMHFKRKLFSIDGIFRRSMEMELNQLVTVIERSTTRGACFAIDGDLDRVTCVEQIRFFDLGVSHVDGFLRNAALAVRERRNLRSHDVDR